MALILRAECAPQCWCTSGHEITLQTSMKMINGCSGVRCGSGITAVDWFFVIVCILFDVWTLFSIGCLPCHLIASIGCSVGKLFPPRGLFSCPSLACAKVAHNALMTLVSFPFDVTVECTLIEIEVKQCQSEEHSSTGLITKFINILGNFEYLLYDVTIYSPAIPLGFLGFFVFMAALGEFILIVMEFQTFYKVNRKVYPEKTQQAKESFGRFASSWCGVSVFVWLFMVGLAALPGVSIIANGCRRLRRHFGVCAVCTSLSQWCWRNTRLLKK